MPKDTEAPPAESVAAESPTGLDRSVSVEVDRDAREVVVAVGDSKARLDVDAALAFRRLVEHAYLEVA